MAKRPTKKRQASMMKKPEIAVRTMNFNPPGSGAGVAEQTNYISLSQCASLLNRRFYRAGLNWAVAGFTVTVTGSLTDVGYVAIDKVPDTWAAKNAYVKSKAMWEKMNEQVLEDQPDLQGRWADFKVYLDADMTQASTQGGTPASDGVIMLPLDAGYNVPQTSGNEWVYSTLQIPTNGGSAPPVEHKIHWLGDSVSIAGQESAGMIHGYGLSRTRPVSTGEPSVPSNGGWMQDLFDVAEVNEEIRDDLAADNDQPPYPVGASVSSLEFYPGGATNLPNAETVGYAVINARTTAGSVSQASIRGTNFMGGLIRVRSKLPGVTSYDLQVHLVPGGHRGYLAEPIEEA